MGASIWTRIALKVGRLVGLSVVHPTLQSIHQDAQQTELYVQGAPSTEIASWLVLLTQLICQESPGRKEGRKEEYPLAPLYLLILQLNTLLWCFALRNPSSTARRYQVRFMANLWPPFSFSALLDEELLDLSDSCLLDLTTWISSRCLATSAKGCKT